MTSFHRKLYHRDLPTWTKLQENKRAFDKAKEVTSYQGRLTLAQFTPAHHDIKPVFGKRQSPPSAAFACDRRCGHPACSQGCVLFTTQT